MLFRVILPPSKFELNVPFLVPGGFKGGRPISIISGFICFLGFFGFGLLSSNIASRKSESVSISSIICSRMMSFPGFRERIFEFKTSLWIPGLNLTVAYLEYLQQLLQNGPFALNSSRGDFLVLILYQKLTIKPNKNIPFLITTKYRFFK